MPQDQLPDVDEVRNALLDALRYEGDQWLWEPVWVLNGSHPGSALDAKISLVQRVILALIDERLVELWLSPGWPVNPTVRLATDRWTELVGDSAAWSDPEHAALLVQVRLVKQP